MTLPSSVGRRNAGFTLLEMLVVIAVMGVALLLLTTAGPPRSHRVQTEMAARQVAESMRAARGQAIAQGRPVRIVLPKLPAWLPVAMRAPRGGIVFEPDGSASGGQILLGSGRPFVVSADWLSGRVRVDAP